MIERVKQIAASFGWAGALAAAVLIAVFLPFATVALVRLTGWDWGIAFALLVALNLVPLAGQGVMIGLAVMGAFTLGQDNLAQRKAAPVAAQTSSPISPADPAAQPTPGTASEGLRINGRSFEDWRKNVAAPDIQQSCLEDVQRRGLTGSAQLDQMARACACYGAAAESIITPDDIEDSKLNPTSSFNERLAAEARKICQRQ